MAHVFSTERSRLCYIETFCIDHLEIIPDFRVDLSRSFFEDFVGRLPGMPFDVLIQLEKTLPAGKDVFDSTCECRELRAVDLQITKVEDKPLAGTIFGANTFYEVKIGVLFLGLPVGFGDSLDEHGRMVSQGGAGVKRKYNVCVTTNAF